MVTYTDPKMVTDTRTTEAPMYGRTATGYGSKLPTRYMVQYAGRWHRVYMAQWGNAGTAYIVHGGQDLVLDTATEHRFA
jgi:hypothetical protein